MSVFAINGVQPFRCCEDWERAQEEGTDNEMYGALLSCDIDWPSVLNVPLGRWEMGSKLAPVRFCPWCGHPVPPPKQMMEIVQGLLAAIPLRKSPSAN